MLMLVLPYFPSGSTLPFTALLCVPAAWLTFTVFLTWAPLLPDFWLGFHLETVKGWKDRRRKIDVTPLPTSSLLDCGLTVTFHTEIGWRKSLSNFLHPLSVWKVTATIEWLPTVLAVAKS